MEFLLLYWPWLAAGVAPAVSFAVSIHVVFTKRDSRAAVAWIAIVWFVPIVGAALYFILGINRIERRARRLRRKARFGKAPAGAMELPAPLPAEAAHLTPLAQLSEKVTGQLLCPGNAVLPLYDGDEAYPAMLEAIDQAQHSIGMSMYIFNNDRTGNRFADALGKAATRGVEVRVLIDDVGANFTWKSIVGPLARAGVRTACFLPTFIPRFFAYAHLRNHRKLLIVDGRVGFTGGINVTDDHCLNLQTAHPIHDMQFRVAGPIVAQVQEIFVEDWKFTTGETLQGERWFPILQPRGAILARGVNSGPDEDLEKLRMVLLGALASARERVLIVTPYFLPDAGLISALNIAALRGVQVEILIPKEGDLRLVRWAATAQLWQVLEHGCRVWLMPEPFLHTKLMLVDRVWTLLGSGNWDARSLRLNFEFDIECYNRDLATMLQVHVEKCFAQAEPVTLATLKRRPPLVKLRDALARLLMPYL